MMTETRFIDLQPEWIRKPKQGIVSDDCIEVITESGTDLWQRTYYGFRNDNAPVLQAALPLEYMLAVQRSALTKRHSRI